MPLFTKADAVLAIRLDRDITVHFSKNDEDRPKDFVRGDWMVINDRGQGTQYYLDDEQFRSIYRPQDEDAKVYLLRETRP